MTSATTLSPIASPVHAPSHVPHLRVVALRDVRPEPVRWIWPGYLPLGKLVVVDGFPGQGKSTFLIDIAARLSRGAPMPDGRGGGAPADTLIFTYEDDAADTLRPRLDAAGGDPARVHHAAGIDSRLACPAPAPEAGNDSPAAHGSPRHTGDNADDLRPASFASDMEAIERAVLEHPDVRLLVIDTLSAALASDGAPGHEPGARHALGRLARLAASHDVCVALVRHVRKNHGANAITAGGGSIGIIGQARVGLLVDRHPDADDMSVLAMIKNNVGPLAPSLAFRRVAVTLSGEGDAAVSTSRLDWTGATAHSADDLLHARTTARTDRTDVADWLREQLAHGPVDRQTIIRAARDAGISDRTVYRVAARLGVVHDREGQGAAHRSTWFLPSPGDDENATGRDADPAGLDRHAAGVDDHADGPDRNADPLAASTFATSATFATVNDVANVGHVAKVEVAPDRPAPHG